MLETFRAWGLFGAIFFASTGASYILNMALLPLLRNYALAQPNVRSSHKTPTPQGGGIAVIASTVTIAALAALAVSISGPDVRQLGLVFVMTVVLAIVGVTDDIRPLEAAPRLLLQTIVVVVVVASLSPDLRVLPLLPWWPERALLVIAILWFINLVNFMDGIDWMTVAEAAPISAALSLFGLMGALPPGATLAAIALCGAIIGFAPFNRPVARLFLGDVGSLPIGLLLFWLLALLAGRGHLVPALLLPLYYIADATITLVRRLIAGESITTAHRGHFYQRAVDQGFTVRQVVGRVFAVNITLAVLAGLALRQSTAIAAFLLLCGLVLVLVLLWTFNSTRVSARS
jgi:UDP-N-acetylmuramyl pentapeptide phosphotransferase/UDP-N-acetylglucosamine-1-phosphate transferase